MRLSEEGLKNRQEWLDKGYQLPKFDREAVKAKTKDTPEWIHFGAGNIFRAFQANLLQGLLNEGTCETGLIVAEGFDYEIIEKMYLPHDSYSVLATLKVDGTVEKTVVGRIVESLTLAREHVAEFPRLKEIFTVDSLKMASFTITEKGYSLVNGKGETLPAVMEDFKNGPDQATSYIGKVAALLYARYVSGQKPIAMVSMDNCSHNGDKLYAAINTFAGEWVKNGVADAGFADCINDKTKVGFPWSMIDKITPRPDANVEKILMEDGLEELEPVITSKKTYVAPFVNAEECQYLVIENAFPNGNNNLTPGGVIYTTRENVDRVEKMKVCTCLNPLHTSLAVYGCLLGYERIYEEMRDPVLKKMVETIGYTEGLPVVVKQDLLDPEQFIGEVINIRLPNPFMPDTPQRIATDTSQKLAIRFSGTISAYAKSESLDVKSLKLIPLVLAGWIRYLMGIDDSGKAFELSPDPQLTTVCPYVKDIRLGETEGVEEKIKPILERTDIFGVDLYEVGLADTVIGYFCELIAGEGAVRATLEKYVMA
ncbi:MAG: mannitol dehydrogenase family protein [Lachnospiraceae bacterium]|nr:mannitol dehydrogenase family protein [Lachnospiraceae bacterium]